MPGSNYDDINGTLTFSRVSTRRFIRSPKLMQQTIAVMAVVALVQAPFIGTAQAHQSRRHGGGHSASRYGDTQEAMKTITVGENVDEDVVD